MEQRAFWTQKYSALQSSEGFRVENYFKSEWTYSKQVCRLFPRYRLAEATLNNLECNFPTPTSPITDTLQAISKAGADAFSLLSAELAVPIKHGDIALESLRQQLDEFEKFINEAVKHRLGTIDPLPYRRVLTDAESESQWQNLNQRWGIRGAGFGWFPINDDPSPDGALTFHEELWNVRNGAGLLQDYLAMQRVTRCFLLRELGPPNYEIDATLAEPSYDGSESFLFTTGQWVVYTSHESSLTLVGPAADFIRHTWSDADQLSYGGPFHTHDLRGSWNSS